METRLILFPNHIIPSKKKKKIKIPQSYLFLKKNQFSILHLLRLPRRWWSKVGPSSNGQKPTSNSHFSGNLRFSSSDNFGSVRNRDCLFECKDITIPVLDFPYPRTRNLDFILKFILLIFFILFISHFRLKFLLGCWETRGISDQKSDFESYFWLLSVI